MLVLRAPVLGALPIPDGQETVRDSPVMDALVAEEDCRVAVVGSPPAGADQAVSAASAVTTGSAEAPEKDSLSIQPPFVIEPMAVKEVTPASAPARELSSGCVCAAGGAGLVTGRHSPTPLAAAARSVLQKPSQLAQRCPGAAAHSPRRGSGEAAPAKRLRREMGAAMRVRCHLRHYSTPVGEDVGAVRHPEQAACS